MGQISMRTSFTEADAMRRTLVQRAVLLLLLAKPARPQEGPLSGSITTGFRFTDVNGYRPKYQELFDLNGGLRLLDLNLAGQFAAKPGSFADRYSLTMSGFGGDPFSTLQFNIRKTRRYDLRINFRQSHYYWNRNDSAMLP